MRCSWHSIHSFTNLKNISDKLTHKFQLNSSIGQIINCYLHLQRASNFQIKVAKTKFKWLSISKESRTYCSFRTMLSFICWLWNRSALKKLAVFMLNLCQKLLFLHQLTHNMTTDCSLNYKFNTWKFQAQTWGEHFVYRNCFWHSEQFLYTTCSPHVLQKKSFWQRFTCTSGPPGS